MAEIAISEEDKRKTLNRVVFSSFLGNFIEWFDYASYSYFATVIALLFFPSADSTVALIKTFAVFALAYLMRPIGAIFWGNMGDKKGRKWALATSILLMSGATFLLGCLPTYLTVGVLAPTLMLLLRMCQSFSASGEYAGASTFIAEYCPKEHRGFYVSMVPASTAVGLLIGSALATLFFSITAVAAGTGFEGTNYSALLYTWLWRIPFWLALPLGWITHYIRTHLEDSPIYTQMREGLVSGEEKIEKPIRYCWKWYKRELFISFGSAVLNAVGFYAVLTYLPNYLIDAVGYDSQSATLITTICLFAYILFIFISGRISDKFGRKRMLITASTGFIILSIPCFLLMNTNSFIIVLLAELIMNLLLTINDGTLASYLAETFPTNIRFTGFALSFNLANAIFGGSCSLICTSLIAGTGNNLAPAFYLMAISAIALVCQILSHENGALDLNEVKGAKHKAMEAQAQDIEIDNR